MRREHVIHILNSHADTLRQAGIAHVSLFGSIARDRAAEASDIDLIIDGFSDRPMTLFRMVRAQEILETIFQRRVDLIAQEGLDHAPELKRKIASEIVRVY
ncbi:MAG: nucleotidyltransferase domain-containing protein [Rhodospirillaceae bacterium]|nr:nucleotidyltransferase domain-containing protein [Rhodospirillaceae bacterium]